VPGRRQPPRRRPARAGPRPIAAGTVTIDEYAYLFTDPKKIRQAVEALQALE